MIAGDNKWQPSVGAIIASSFSPGGCNNFFEVCVHTMLSRLSRMQAIARRCMSTRPAIRTSAGEGVSRVVVVAQPIEDKENLKQWAHDTPINNFKDCKLPRERCDNE